MIGANVTEMIAELVVARKLETTGEEIIKSVHPHPTMSEAIMEAAAAAYGEVIHIWRGNTYIITYIPVPSLSDFHHE